MLDQNFSSKNLLRLVKRSDPRKHGLGKKRSDYRQAIEKIALELEAPAFAFSNQSPLPLNGETIYRTSNRTDIFASRKLCDNLARIHDVKQASRSQIIEQISILLAESAPFFVTKLDVHKFYNNVDRAAVVDEIIQDSRPIYHTKRYLKLLMQTKAFVDEPGVPRGVGLSAIISEIAMKVFDREISRFEGVYFYARYVDDMIVFSYSDPKPIITHARKSLPPGMTLNDSKQQIFSFSKKECIEPKKDLALEYLGYRFEFKAAGAKGDKFKVGIAHKKIKKIKTKIMLALFDFIKSKDLLLCEDRLKFLSGNVAMRSSSSGGTLYSGIYYNYPLVDESAKEQLRDLDNFLRRAIFSAHGAFGASMSSALTLAQKRALSRYSFTTGYNMRIRHNFNIKRLSEIARCWK
jgi:hypothetical protein